MIEEVFDEDSAVKSNQQIQQQVSDILTQLINYAGEYIQTEDTSILDLIEQSLTPIFTAEAKRADYRLFRSL
ncbi:hypothetical protein [Metabacillus idriensis]|uniref:hypothetical protein n=1 Tax=Metabacillus idriensis TaxID=324768 RepID=UPI00174882A9|nr:hypothetical protein [Metabacillus idriensis]